MAMTKLAFRIRKGVSLLRGPYWTGSGWSRDRGSSKVFLDKASAAREASRVGGRLTYSMTDLVRA